MGRQRKPKKEIERSGIEIIICSIILETTLTPSNDFMPEEEWKMRARDVPDDFFARYRRREIDGDPGSYGYYYDSRYSKNPVYVTEDFLFFFQFQKYYCLQASLSRLPMLLDATAYTNAIELAKAAGEISMRMKFREGHECVCFSQW